MKKVVVVISLLGLFITSLFIDSSVMAANRKTLGDYKRELNELERKQASNNAMSAKTKQEIQNKRSSINSANNNIEINKKKVEEAKQKIIESEEEIKQTNEELNDLMRYLQMTKGENVYLEYIANASSISDLIKRTSVVEQISTYQKEEIARLESLIKEKEQLQLDLAESNKQLEVQIKEYEKKIEELDSYMDKYAQIGLDTADQIKAQKEIIKTYEKAGCKDNESIDDCFNNKFIVSAAGFLRPLKSGRVNSLYGRGGNHFGIDLGVPQGTNIYASAPGVVAAVKYKSSCGGNIVYVHHNINGKAYTTEYAHMLTINVSNGQAVTTGTVVGTVGGGPNTWSYDHCTSGVHLHYAVAYGHYLGSGSSGFSSWSTWKKNTKATADASIIGIKNQKGWSWSSR